MKTIIILLLVIFSSGILSAQIPLIHTGDLPYALYPAVNEHQPALPSPFRNQNKEEFVIAVTNDNRYAIIPVTLSDERAICRQLIVDTLDFPTLAQTGLHSDEQLAKIKTITNRPVEEITALGRPGALSQGGFMAADEDIVSVLQGDNHLVRRLQLTHPEVARPLFHVLNLMDEDLALNRWNMARHQWEHISYFFYNGRKVMGQGRGYQRRTAIDLCRRHRRRLLHSTLAGIDAGGTAVPARKIRSSTCFGIRNARQETKQLQHRRDAPAIHHALRVLRRPYLLADRSGRHRLYF